MKTVNGVLCIIEVKDEKRMLDHDNNIILTENGEAKEWKKIGQLQLPGGGIEWKETYIECAQRELLDELNLNLSADKLLYIGDDTFDIVWYQTSEKINITVHLLYACISFEYFENIKSYRSSETQDIMIKQISELSNNKHLRPGTLSHIHKYLKYKTDK